MDETLLCDYLNESYTPNANMADRSVVARHEWHESEANQSSMFCRDSVSPKRSCFVVDLGCFCLAFPISFCVPECHRKEVKSSTAEKVCFFRFRGCLAASNEKQAKERSSRLSKELLKFLENA